MIPTLIPEIQLADPAWAHGIADLKGKLERFAHESRITRAFMVRVADEVFAAEALESFDRAAQVPLKQSTLERKARYQKSPAGRRGNRRTTSSLVPLDPVPAAMGLFAALTLDTAAASHSPVAVREFTETSMLFGTKRWVGKYASAHYWGVPKHNIPARLDWLRTGESQKSAEEKLKDLVAEWTYGAMERAGFDHGDIVAFFDSDENLRGRY